MSRTVMWCAANLGAGIGFALGWISWQTVFDGAFFGGSMLVLHWLVNLERA